MKNSYCLFLLVTVCSFSQFTLEHTYDENVITRVKLAHSGEKYFSYDVLASQIILYNADHSFWKSIDLQIPANALVSKIADVSEYTINSDDNIEILFSWSHGTPLGQENYTTILSETGETLLTVANSTNSEVSRISGLPDKLLVTKTNADTDVFTLPGLAQEHAYVSAGAFGNVLRCSLEMSGEKYFQIYAPLGQVIVYNSDHSFWKAINAPKPDGYSYQPLNGSSISETDINLDSAIELIYNLSDGLHLTASIVSENNEILFPPGILSSAHVSKIPGLPNKLMGDTFPWGLSTNVYSIPSLTLEHAYAGRMKRVNLENSGEKYHTAIADEAFKAYNSDHTLWKTFNLPVPAPYTGFFVDLVSEIRLSADPLLEVGFSYYFKPDMATTLYESAIINESGATLLSLPDTTSLYLSDIDGLEPKIITKTLSLSGFDGYDFGGVVYGVDPELKSRGFVNESIKVFPNPASDVVFLKSKTLLTAVSLYDLSGMPVYKATSANEINVRRLPAGLYLLYAIDATGKTYSKKLIVEKG